MTLNDTMQYYTTVYKIIQHYIRLYGTIRHYTTLYKTIQQYIRLYDTVRHYIVQRYTRLYDMHYARLYNTIPQGAQALICISVVCFSVYLFYECLYIAF
jgi:hypothetical protein